MVADSFKYDAAQGIFVVASKQAAETLLRLAGHSYDGPHMRFVATHDGPFMLDARPGKGLSIRELDAVVKACEEVEDGNE